MSCSRCGAPPTRLRPRPPPRPTAIRAARPASTPPAPYFNATRRCAQSAPELARFLAEDPEAQQRAHAAYKRGASAGRSPSPARLAFLDAEVTEEEELVRGRAPRPGGQ